MDLSDPQQVTRAFWRRQVILSLLTALALVPAGGVYFLATGAWGRDPQHAGEMWVVAGAVMAVLAVLLGAMVLHTVRIARYTFRIGDK